MKRSNFPERKRARRIKALEAITQRALKEKRELTKREKKEVELLEQRVSYG